MRQFKDLVISDRAEEVMLYCMDAYSIHSYFYFGNNVIGLGVCEPSLLHQAMKAQRYLSRKCPWLKWYAGLEEWMSEGEIFCLNQMWR